MRTPARIPRKTRRMLWIVLTTYLLAVVLVTVAQRKLIYFPTMLPSELANRLAAEQKLERWTDPSGRTIGWKRLSQAPSPKGQVLIFHGNAALACQCGHYANVIQETAPL